MNVPQVMMATYMGLMVIGGVILNGKPKTGKYEFGEIFIEMLLLFAILYAGGFWG